MSKALPLLFAVWCAFGQDPTPPADAKPVEKIPSEKAPPELNDALMKRVSGFYQAHVDGKFRLADQFVAEESKDDFFVAPKQKFESFDIMKIGYFDDFKKAEVTVATKGTSMISGEKMSTSMPMTTNWKLVDGVWFWYVAPVTEFNTPFGKMHFNSGAAKDNAARSALPGDPAALAKQILTSVKTDKEEIMLSSFEPAKAEFKVTNGMAGQISIKVEADGVPKELTFKVDKEKLLAGEVATVTVAYKPANKVPKPSAMMRVYVDPVNLVLPVKVLFAIPPELEKQIPKLVQPRPSQQP